MVEAQVEYKVQPVTLDRFCLKHSQLCESEIDEVFVAFASRGILELIAYNSEHAYMYRSDYTIPQKLLPEWVEEWVNDAVSV